MEFLKSCTTNVHVVDNAFHLPCAIFAQAENAQSILERSSQFYTAVAELRERNTLCAVKDERLWILTEEIDEIAVSVERLGFRLDGTAAGTEKTNVVRLAVEGALAYKLAAAGLVHVGVWTWLFPGAMDGEDLDYGGTTIKLEARATDAGSLYIMSHLRPSEIFLARPLSREGESSACILAPSGRQFQTPISSGNGSTPTVRHESWKSCVADMLRSEGLQLLEADEWSEIELSHHGDPIRFFWPRKLVLQHSSWTDLRSIQDSDWRQWFDSSSAHAFRDPLALAEEWFTGAAAREAATNANEDAENEAVDASTTWDATADLVTSPPFNQRMADQQAVASGIYPTPPDGLLPGTQGTQQPTSDGASMPPITESAEILPGDEMEGLRQSVSSSTNAPAPDFNANDDDLFGDMGEIDFGGNEVGDADFDYFDEPDELPPSLIDAQSARLDVNMTDVTDARPAGYDDQPVTSAKEALRDAVTDNYAADPTEKSGHDENPPAEAEPAAAPGSPPSQDLSTQDDREQPNRPLSPFGIRERLLPPPIPASAARIGSQQTPSLRRSSTFGPVTFNEGFDTGAKYRNDELMRMSQIPKPESRRQSLFQPPQHKRPRSRKPLPDVDDSDTYEDSQSSVEDTSTSDREQELPHKPPWQSRKRKRTMPSDAGMIDEDGELEWMRGVTDGGAGQNEVSTEKIFALQKSVLLPVRDMGTSTDPGLALAPRRKDGLALPGDEPDQQGCSEDSLVAVDQLFEDFDDLDLIYIAQIVSEQSLSIIPRLVNELEIDVVVPSDGASLPALVSLIEQAIASIMPGASTCDLNKLALPRETARQTAANTSKGPTGVPRPPQRSDSTQQGPDYCPLPPPYLRIQRYGDMMEMLPPAIHFWSTLGLSPASGPKDVRTVSVVPDNLDLVHLVKDFVYQLKLVYEANKLGSWRSVSCIEEAGDQDALTISDGSTVVVHPLESADDMAIADTFITYSTACELLGKALAHIGHEDPDRTILVCMLNPFSGARAQQALCACFWTLYKAYRDNVPKAHRTAQRSDLVLRIIPCDLVASPDGMVILDQQQLAQLAMEIYDRCPPSAKAAANKDVPNALMPYFSAPAVELATPTPRRIPFQLTAEPPNDLLHENSVLHLAYAISADRQWMSFYWMDASGRYQTQLSACLRGKSIADVVNEAWERTGEWLRARDVTWRVYIVSIQAQDKSISDCWKTVVSKKPRRQPLHVTLLSLDDEPDLKLTPPPPPSATQTTGEKQGPTSQGFLTPVTTPSGTTMTVSPDASANMAGAPPTPAPSDPLPDGDGDAHLVDIADESWAVMLAPAFATSSSAPKSTTKPSGVPASAAEAPVLASGMLFRRGPSHTNQTFSSNPTASSTLEALQVDLHWDIRLRPNGAVDEGPVRQAEFTLREVLKLYRGLGVLRRARGLAGEGNSRGDMMPLHVLGATRGVGGLEGMLGQ